MLLQQIFCVAAGRKAYEEHADCVVLGSSGEGRAEIQEGFAVYPFPIGLHQIVVGRAEEDAGFEDDVELFEVRVVVH